MSFTKYAIPLKNNKIENQNTRIDSNIHENKEQNKEIKLTFEKNVKSCQRLKNQTNEIKFQNDDQFGELAIRIQDPRSKSNILSLRLNEKPRIGSENKTFSHKNQNQLQKLGKNKLKKKLVGMIQIKMLQKNGENFYELEMSLRKGNKSGGEKPKMEINDQWKSTRGNLEYYLQIQSKSNNNPQNKKILLKKRNFMQMKLNETPSVVKRIKKRKSKSKPRFYKFQPI